MNKDVWGQKSKDGVDIHYILKIDILWFLGVEW